MYVYTTILHRVQRVKQHTSSTSVLRVRYNYITSCAKCKTAYIVHVCFTYEYTTMLPRVQHVKQHTSSTSVLCMSIQLYYLVNKVCNNTHRLHLFYACVYNHVAAFTTCKTTYIVYICFMYEIQLYYLVYNVWSNTDRVPLFYICVYDYITLCTTCKTTHIVYICFIYEIQLDYLVYNG